MLKKKKIFYNKLFPDKSIISKSDTESGSSFISDFFEKLKIDDESVSYISVPIDASRITKIIKNHLEKYNIDSLKLTITDCTAGVGGDSISFSKFFKTVNSIEIDTNRFNYLLNNINAYEINNVNCYNEECIKYLKQSEQDIIFIDPPWGGFGYKLHDRIRLKLNNSKIEKIIRNLLFKKIYLFVLKLPKNYDFEFLFRYIKKYKDKVDIYLYNLEKMSIVVIENIDMIPVSDYLSWADIVSKEKIAHTDC